MQVTGQSNGQLACQEIKKPTAVHWSRPMCYSNRSNVTVHAATKSKKHNNAACMHQSINDFQVFYLDKSSGFTLCCRQGLMKLWQRIQSSHRLPLVLHCFRQWHIYIMVRTLNLLTKKQDSHDLHSEILGYLYSIAYHALTKRLQYCIPCSD